MRRSGEIPPAMIVGVEEEEEATVPLTPREDDSVVVAVGVGVVDVEE